MSLVETDWLEKNLKNVKILDCTWHMPQTKRNGFEEYKQCHISKAIFLIWMIIQTNILVSHTCWLKKMIGKK